MGFNKNNDWVAVMMNVESNNNIQLGNNPNLTLYSNGITPDNTGLKDKDYYKNIPQVQKRFSDTDGEFNEIAFNQFYDSAARAYQEFAEIDYVEKMLDEVGVSPYDSSRLTKPSRKVQNVSAVITPFHDKNRTTYGTSNLWETGSATFSDREVAQANFVRDENGNKLDWTPNDRSGFKSLFNPALAYASYDEDVYDENGRLIHQKGELKLDENGDPYTELLGNREAFNKDIVRWSDTLTVEGTFLNKLDVFDSDSMEKSVGKVVGKTALMIAPYFTPIGAIWGWTNAVGGFLTAMPSLIKSLDGLFTGEVKDKSTMNWLENTMGRFKPTTSDKAKGKFWSVENLGDLVISSSAQLYSQRGIANALAKWAPFKDPKSNELLARSVSTGYMAMTSATDSYASFKEAGASDRVAGAGTLLTMAGFYTLLSQGYFKEKLFEGSLLDEDQRTLHNIKQLAEHAVKKNFSDITTESKEETAKGLAKAWSWMKTKIKNAPKGFAYETNSFVSRSINEGIEETAEELTQDLVKGLTKALEACGVDCTEDSGKLDYNWDLKSALKRYGTSFVGGALGGAVFEAYNLRELYKDPNYKKLLSASPVRRMYHDIAQGKAEQYRKAIIARSEAKKNGNENLSASYKSPDGPEGKKIYTSGTASDNQNDAVTNELLRMVDVAEAVYAKHGLIYSNTELLETILETESMKKYLEENHLTKEEFAARDLMQSMAGANYSAEAEAIIEALFEAEYETEDGKKGKIFDAIAENVLNDVNEIRREIAEKEVEINTRLEAYPELERKTDEDRKRLIKSNSYLKKLVEERDALVKEFQDIISGKRADSYLTQTLMFFDNAMFNAYVGLGNEKDHNSIRNIQNFARFKHGIADYDSIKDDSLKEFIADDYEAFITKRHTQYRNVANLHIYLSEQLQQQLQSVEDLLKDATESDKYLFDKQRMTIESAITALNEERAKVEKRLGELINAGIDEGDEKFKEVTLRIASIKRNLNYFESLPKEMRFDDWFNYNLGSGSTTEDLLRKQEYIKSFYQDSVSKKAVYVKDDLLRSYLRSIDFNYVFRLLKDYSKTFADEHIDGKSVIQVYVDESGDPSIAVETIGNALDVALTSGTFDIEAFAEEHGLDDGLLSMAIDSVPTVFLGDMFTELQTKVNDVINTLKQNPKNLSIVLENLYNYLNGTDSNGIPYIKWERFANSSVEEFRSVKSAEDFVKTLFDPSGTNDIIKFVLETNDIIKNLPKSPIIDLLQDISMRLTGQPSNIFEIIREQRADIDNVGYDQYLMSDSVKKQIYDAEGILNVLEGLLTGSMYGNMNELINTKRDKPLTILSPNTVEILKKEFGFVKDQFKVLKKVSETNEGNKIAENKNIAKVDSVKRFLSFVNPAQGSWIEEIEKEFVRKYGNADGSKKFTSFKDFASKHNFDLEKIDQWTEEDYDNFYIVESEFKENLFNWFNALEEAEQEAVMTAIASCTANSLELVNMSEDEFSADPTVKPGAWGNVRYLLSNLTTSNSEFQGFYEKAVDETKEFLPFHNQEFAIRDAYSSFAARDLYNKFIDSLFKKFKETYPDDKFVTEMKAIRNFFFIDGAPGSGKSSAVTSVFIKVLQNRYGADLQVIAMVQDETRRKEFAETIGIPESQTFVADDFIEDNVYSGIKEAETVDESTHHTKTKIDVAKVKGINTFGNGAAKKFLFVCDEATFINEAQLTALDLWLAKYNNGKSAFMLGLGDLYQSGAETDKHTDITDVYLPMSVRLTSSFRAENNGKANNETIARGILKSAISEWRNDRSNTNTRTLSEMIYNGFNDLQKDFIGYEDPVSGEIFGDVQTQSSRIPEIIQKLLVLYEGKTPSICIITNNKDSYNEYVAKGVDVRTAKEAQGGQWDYIITDLDFTFSENNAFLKFKSFYTVMTRAKKGTVWTGPVNGIKMISSSDSKRAVGQDMKSEAIREEYMKWRKKLFSLIPKTANPSPAPSPGSGPAPLPGPSPRPIPSPVGGNATRSLDKLYSAVTDEEIDDVIDRLYDSDTDDPEILKFRAFHREHVENYKKRKELIESGEAVDYDTWHSWISDDKNLLEKSPFKDNVDLESYRDYLRFASEIVLECLSGNDIQIAADLLQAKFEGTTFEDINRYIVNSIKSKTGSFYLRKVGEVNGTPQNIIYFVCRNNDSGELITIPLFANRSTPTNVDYSWNDVASEFKVKPVPISSNGGKFVPFEKMSKKVAISDRIVIFKGVPDNVSLTDSQAAFQDRNKGKAFILVSKKTDPSVHDDWSDFLELKYNEDGQVTSFIDPDGNLYMSLAGVQRVCTEENFKNIFELLLEGKSTVKKDEEKYNAAMESLEQLLGYRVDMNKEHRSNNNSSNPDRIFSPDAVSYLINLFIHNANVNPEQGEAGIYTLSRLNKDGNVIELNFGDNVIFDIVNIEGELYIVANPTDNNFNSRDGLIKINTKLENKGSLLDSFGSFFANAIVEAFRDDDSIKQQLSSIGLNISDPDFTNSLKTKLGELNKSDNFVNKFEFYWLAEDGETSLLTKRRSGIIDKLIDVVINKDLRDSLFELSAYFKHHIHFNIFATEFKEDGAWGFADPDVVQGFGTDVVDVLPTTYTLLFHGKPKNTFNLGFEQTVGEGEVLEMMGVRYDKKESVYKFYPSIKTNKAWLDNNCTTSVSSKGSNYQIISFDESTGEIELEYRDASGNTRVGSVELKSETAQVFVLGMPEKTYRDGDLSISDGDIKYNNREVKKVLGFQSSPQLSVLVFDGTDIILVPITFETKSMLEQHSELKGFDLDIIKTYQEGGITNAIAVNKEGFFVISDLTGTPVVNKTHEINELKKTVNGQSIANFDMIRIQYKLDTKKSAFVLDMIKSLKQFRSVDQNLASNIKTEIEELINSPLSVTDIVTSINELLSKNAYALGVLYVADDGGNLSPSNNPKYSYGRKVFEILEPGLSIINVEIGNSPKFVVTLEDENGNKQTRTYVYDNASQTVKESKFDKKVLDDLLSKGRALYPDFDQTLVSLGISSINTDDISKLKINLAKIYAVYQDDSELSILIESINDQLMYC